MNRVTLTTIFIIFLTILMAGCGSTPEVIETQSENLPWIDSFMESDPEVLISAIDSLDFNPDEDVRLIYTEGRFDFDSEGNLLRRFRYVYQIITEQGKENWSDVSTTWHPWYQVRPELKARITNPDGSVHFLLPEHIVENASQSNSGKIFSDSRILRAPLPSIMAGSIVEYEVIQNEKAAFPGAGSYVSWYFRLNNAIKFSNLIISVPEDIPFQYKLYLKPDTEPQITENNGVKTCVFSSEDIQAEQDVETGVPSDQPRWQSIRFSTAESWQVIAAAYSKMVDESLAKYDFSQLLNTIDIKSLDVREASLRMMDLLTSRVRYTGMELGERSIIPAGPQETLDRGYGDCKEKALILTGMLRQAGYSAYLALLNVNNSQDTDPDIPGLGSFDHAIVYVNEDGGFFIDATSEFNRLGALPLVDRGRYALVASPQTETLIKTKGRNAEEDYSYQQRDIYLADSGQGKIVELISYDGPLESNFRSLFFNMDEEQRWNQWESYANDEFRSEKLVDVDIPDPGDLSEPFVITVTADEAKITYTEDYISQAVIFPNDLLDWLPDFLHSEIKNARVNEYQLNFPFSIDKEIRIYPPEGFLAAGLPEDEVYDLGTMTASRTIADKGDYVEVLLSFNTGKTILTAEEFNKTNAALKEFYQKDGLLINFYHEGQMLLEEGDYKAALEKFQELIEKSPDNAMHRLRYARALLQAGFASSAENAINTAIELNPEEADFYSELGWILQHDEISRRFYPGYQKDKAIEAYEKAIELDPDNWKNYANLAILYEYDEEGLRYTSQEDLKTAAGYYEKTREIEDVLVLNLLINYFYTSEYDKMKALLEKVEDKSNKQAYTLLYEAGANGADVAIKYASTITSKDERREALKSAVNHLLKQRMYDTAVLFLREAAKNSSEAMSLEQRADYISRIVPWEEKAFSDSKAEDLPGMFYRAAVLSDKDDFSNLEKICDPRFYDYAVSEDSDRTLRTERFEMLQEVKDNETKKDNLLDSLLAGYTVITEEKKSGAAMVKLKSTTGGDTIGVFFLLKEDGIYKIVSARGYAASLGKVIVESYQNGKQQLAIDFMELFHKEYYNLEDPKDPFFSLRPFEQFLKRTDIKDYILYAGASMMSDSIYLDEGVEVLEKGLAKTAAKDQTLFYYALYYKYLSQKRMKEYTNAGAMLYAYFTESKEAFIRYLGSSIDMNPEFLEREARQWMAANEEDADIYHVVLQRYADERRFREADRIFEEMTEKSFVDANEYNNQAWMGLFRPELTDQDLSNARMAVSLSNSAFGYILHTMAALYAQTGRCQEARTMLDKVIELSGEMEIQSMEWYVLGRIAEEYGIMDFALDAYIKVEPPEIPEIDKQSCYALTQIRLKEIKDRQ